MGGGGLNDNVTVVVRACVRACVCVCVTTLFLYFPNRYLSSVLSISQIDLSCACGRNQPLANAPKLAPLTIPLNHRSQIGSRATVLGPHRSQIGSRATVLTRK
jgi:hypothetical protein